MSIPHASKPASSEEKDFWENVHPQRLAQLDDRMVARSPGSKPAVSRIDDKTSNSNSTRRSLAQSLTKSLKRSLASPRSPSRPSKIARTSQMINTSSRSDKADSEAIARIRKESARVLEEREKQLLEREKVMRDELEKQRKETEVKLTNTQKALIQFVKESATSARLRAKRKWMDNNRLLGRIDVERSTIGTSHGVGESWIEGEQISSLRTKRAELEKKRAIVKNKKAAIRKSLSQLGSDESSFTLNLDMEILNAHNVTLLAEDKALHAELQRLTVAKLLHLRETKRIRDEENCKFSDFPVLSNRYVLLELLGKGGFSEVYKAYDIINLRNVACKVHQLYPLWSEARKSNYSRHAIREYNIHKTLDHPRIVRFFDIFEIDENSFCTVLNYCEGGDLDDLLKKNGCLTLKLTRVMIAQVVQGLNYLHSQAKPIIHYDLKPGNILFHEGQIKITDFGLSKQLESTESGVTELTSQGAGTYWYLPPECFEVGSQPPQISPKVDVWSLGVITYQLLFGKKPFGHDMSQQGLVANNVISRGISVTFPEKPVISKEAKEFIHRCLTPNPSLRATISDLLVHPFIRDKAAASVSNSSRMAPPSKGNTAK